MVISVPAVFCAVGHDEFIYQESSIENIKISLWVAIHLGSTQLDHCFP